jgi:hypothetical protein
LGCSAKVRAPEDLNNPELEIQTLPADLAIVQHDYEVCAKRLETVETELAKMGRGDGRRGDKPRPEWLDRAYGFTDEGRFHFAIASARTAYEHSVTLESAKTRAQAELSKLTSQPGELLDHWVDPKDGTVYALVGEQRAFPVSGSKENFEATPKGVLACARALESRGSSGSATNLKMGLAQVGDNPELLRRLLTKCESALAGDGY